ncbi:Tripartite tricarboxylate transporter TctB family protein [compost metagenome]
MKADRIIFVCILVLAAIYFYAIEQIPTLQVGDPIGAKAIPRFLGGALLVTAALLFFEMQAAVKKGKEVEVAKVPEDKGPYVLVAAVVVLTAVYFIAFEFLGYAIATTIYLNVLMAYFNKGKWKTNVLTATLFSFGSYLAFTKLFGTPLAPGLLPF